ncbi:MipA/OmpV family protein [Breoghania sp.]|uniref:MipA/OmpV family protein n=1 Tax=Breoghania sp. TaxID=2065378 RepID=UPI00260FA208|nr:MipA/OmpV family protein [Breoghania sp.]MDJ0931079.1 MipA/OmpV family protein [Breoghania sp.]
MSTYFGVSSSEAAASGGVLTTHDAGGGIRDVELALGADYMMSDKVTLYADAEYRRFCWAMRPTARSSSAPAAPTSSPQASA